MQKHSSGARDHPPTMIANGARPLRRRRQLGRYNSRAIVCSLVRVWMLLQLELLAKQNSLGPLAASNQRA